MNLLIERSEGQKRFHLTIILFIIFAILLSYSVYSSIEYPGENSYSIEINGIQISASPIFIYFKNSFLVSTVIIFMINNTRNYSESLTLIISPGSGEVVKNISLLPGQFIKFSIPLTPDEMRSSILTINILSGNLIHNIEIKISQSIISAISEISFLASILFYSLFLFSFRCRSKKIPYLLLGGLILIAPFFGQRYDMYFMISSPLHLLHGVNPFIASKSIPGGLKWEYPPLYLYYGMAVEYILIHVGLIRFPHNVIFSGVLWGYNYMAWRGIVGGYLPGLYLIMKLPMIVSTFLIYSILNKEKLGYNLTKIWLLNPAVILIGILWGQLDVITALLLVFSITQLKRGNSSIAALSATVGAYVKIFSVFMIPIILIESRHKVRDLLIVIVISLASILPYIFIGNFRQDIMELIYTRSVPSYANLFSANGITWQVILMDIGVKSFPSLSILIFLPSFIAIIVLYWKRRMDIMVTLILIFSVFFLTYNFVNPQYFILVIPIFLMMKQTRFLIIYSAIPAIYVFLTYQLPYFINPFLSYNYFSSYLGQVEHLRQYITSSYPVLWPFIIVCTGIYLYTFYWALKESIMGPWHNFPENVVFP